MDAVAGLPGNALGAGIRVQRAASDLTDATVKGLTGDEGVADNGGILGDYGNQTKLREAGIQFKAADPKSAAILQNPGAFTPQEVAAAEQTFNTYAATQFGVKGPTAMVSYDGKELSQTPEKDTAKADGVVVKKSILAGFYDKENQIIAINERHQDGSTQDRIETDGHELKHYLNAATKTNDTEAGASRFGDQTYTAFADEVGVGAGPNSKGQQTWTNTYANNGGFTVGNGLASGAKDVEPKLYVYQGHVIGTDKVDDKKVVVVGKKEYYSLLSDSLLPNAGDAEKAYADLDAGVLKVDRDYQTNGKEYDLTKPKDFETLRLQTDMTYEGGTEMGIYYQNGMKTSLEKAEKDAKFIGDFIGQPVGIINNKTHNWINPEDGGDVVEYLPNGYALKDALTAYQYEKISKNGEKNLIILHSAGNEDAYKAMGVLKLENRNLNNNVSFVSVASPRNLGEMTDRAGDVGADIVGQYNNRLDPITWGPVKMTAGIVGAVAVTAYLAPSLIPAAGDYTIPVGAVGGAGVESLGIYLNHGIDRYLSKDYMGVATDIKKFVRENPLKKN